ncbi:MAG TPA: rRNA pseudouridine synthase [Candidatus Omnitrophica bacterium]|nr:MAG: pseudouridine synthase [Candidatus Omnitrophota bacterium]RKY34864.1 MAG: pseudouridine synthase [Candidatus Omnitrophota bacterium]RKY44774.1 MAG: pseudouridine synthase [Candidatus Omnitrophota bacterium]HEC69220.1 rRNA pseudouridine synthase [Candidatus Omnitrophota bacterium]
MRLNKFIAKSGYCSRRQADILIKQGKVKVGRKIVKEPWQRVKDGDQVTIENKVLKIPQSYIYLILNKPKGFVVTKKDKFAKKTIYELLPKRFKNLFPVGRLDKDSRGLLILTNDGDFSYQYTHPKFEVEKEYILVVRGKFTEGDVSRAYQGIKEGEDFLRVKKIKIQRVYPNKTKLSCLISEGKKRHLRKLFSSLGFKVLDLKRVRMGDFSLGNLKEGQFKITKLSNDRH